jgi:hypothetical protein
MSEFDRQAREREKKAMQRPLQQPLLRKVDQLHPVGDACLGEDAVDMVLYGLQGDEEGTGNFAV